MHLENESFVLIQEVRFVFSSINRIFLCQNCEMFHISCSQFLSKAVTFVKNISFGRRFSSLADVQFVQVLSGVNAVISKME